MPRDAAGSYSLVAGNPVLSGTVISSSWANNTLNDVSTALTDSLDRYGRGGMLAPFRFADGTKLLPSASFVNEISSGLYRDDGGDVRMSVLAQDVMRWQISGVQIWNNTLSQWFTVITDGTAGRVPVDAGTVEGQTLYWKAADNKWTYNSAFKINPTDGIITVGVAAPGTGIEGGQINILANDGGLGWSFDVTGTEPTAQGRLFNSSTTAATDLVIGQTGVGNTGSIEFYTSGVNRIKIKDDGLVGIGTATPIEKLDVDGAIRWNGSSAGFATTTSVGMADFNTGGTRFGSFGADATTRGTFAFYQAGQDDAISQVPLVIDVDGNVGIGTIAPLFKMSVEGNVDNSASLMGLSPKVSVLIRNTSGATLEQKAELLFSPSNNGSTLLPPTSAISGSYETFDAGGFNGGALLFGTQTNAIEGIKERMRITNDGYVLIGRTVPDPDGASLSLGITIQEDGFLTITGRPNSVVASFNRKLGGGTGGAVIRIRNEGTLVGSISVNGAVTSYNTSSDYRLKKNVMPMTDAINRLNLLKPCNFDWVSDGLNVDGFIAHEAQEVIPECISGIKDQVDESGSPVMQGIDQSKIVPLITAALQELISRVEALEA